jgi:hypothetical protein|nr:hypothetical protein [uncultured Emticicia sp.]
MILTARYLFENLEEEVKKKHGIRSLARLDCTEVSGFYNGLNPFRNKKGMIYLFPTETDDFVEYNGKRVAMMALTNGTLNLSSLFFEDLDCLQFSYGYPNARTKLRDGSENPLLPFRFDGYLFLTDKELKRIELFIVVGGKNCIREFYCHLLDGELDSEINRLRAEARPYFNY